MSNSEQLPLLNIIDHQPSTYAQADAPSPRTGPSPGSYGLSIGDRVRILPFTDPWGIERGSFPEAIITGIYGAARDRITLNIPGVSQRAGYICGIERVQKL